MKKTFFALALSIISLLSINASAEIFLPKTVSIGDKTSYDAGVAQNITLINSEKSIGKQEAVEYGIARAIQSGPYTTFEILTTNSLSVVGQKEIGPLSVIIPNLIDTKSTSTFVAYVKFFEKNNEDNEGFYFSKEFSIIANATPFVNVKNINLLLSNGYRFTTQEGPTIYKPEEVAKVTTSKLASTSSIEVTFESNVDTVVTPTITFSKIRSDSFNQTITADPLTIKKGKNYFTIPLPTFEYAPGVYMGSLTLGGGFIKNKYDFQYIVAGDSVSIGTVSVTQEEKNNFFNFELFGNPLDLYREDISLPASTSSSSPQMYKVSMNFLDASGYTKFSVTQDVDFSQRNFKVQIPSKYKYIGDVQISITSPTTGAVVYESTKSVNYRDTSPSLLKMVLYIMLYVILIIGMIISLVKKNFKTFILLLVLLVGLFFIRNVFAQNFPMEAYSQGRQPVSLRVNSPEYYPRILMRDDVVNTVYECGQPITLVFKINYTNCSNSVPAIQVGASQASMAAAKAGMVGIGDYGGATSGALWTSRGHQAFSYQSGSVALGLSAPTATTSPVYMYVKHNPVPNDLYHGFNSYAFSVKNSCDMVQPTCECSGRTQICKKGGLTVSTTPNASACALQASCSVSRTGTTASFNAIVTNSIGAVTYKDADTGQTITNPVQREVAVGATIVQKILVTDTDGSTATATCSSANDGDGPGTTTPPGGPNGPGTTTVSTSTPPRVPTITTFKPRDLVVPKNRACQYSWTVKDVDRCALRVNNTSVLLQGNGLTGPVDVSAADGNNQRATITCVAEDLPADEGTISTSTLCQVLPEVIER